MAGGGSHIFFQTTETRARDGPQSVLGNYRGYLQADANSVYDAFFKDGSVLEVGCWAHYLELPIIWSGPGRSCARPVSQALSA